MKKLKIVIIDEDIRVLAKMNSIIAANPSVSPFMVLVRPLDGCQSVADAARSFEPDMILTADPLGEYIETHEFLKALGGDFYKVNEGIAGNPRVIITSQSHSPEVLPLMGGLFERKGDLVSEYQSVRTDAADHLMAVVSYAVERLRRS